MSDDDDVLRESLKRILRSRGASSKHQLARASAARTLARLQGEKPEPPAPRKPHDDADAMAQVCEAYVPNFRQQRDDDEFADPMRDLAAQLQLGGCMADERIWAWLPACPPDVAEAEREILDALDRL